MTGWVEDVRPYIAGAGLYVIPLRIGTGIRLKVLGAMTMGKAIVSILRGCPRMPRTARSSALFQSMQEFNKRYATLGFQHEANLDEAGMWPVAFALKALTAAEEATLNGSGPRSYAQESRHSLPARCTWRLPTRIKRPAKINPRNERPTPTENALGA